MRTLTEIETAADLLPVEQKEQLLLFLATRLRAAGAALPEPRQLSREEIAEWIAEDETDMRQFRDNPETVSRHQRAAGGQRVGKESVS